MSYTRTKRSPRCSYCYTTGHTRNNCPTAKQEAASGNEFAKKVVERAAIKKCSYCNDTTHTKTTCEKFYSDQKDRAQKLWVGALGIVDCIKSLRLAEGAFLYAPMTYYSNQTPSRENEDYELINFTIEKVELRSDRTDNEFLSAFKCNTLAEPMGENRSWRNWIPAPGLYEAVVNLQTEYTEGKRLWLRENDASGYSRIMDGRSNLKDQTQVLVPASDEAVNAAVNRILQQKPDILKHPDRKSYQKAMRAAKKASNNGEEV